MQLQTFYSASTLEREKDRKHGLTKQTQEACDNINKQVKAHVRNKKTQNEDRAGS